MNDICRNFFPDSPVGCKVSFDEKLRDAGLELYNLMESDGELTSTFPTMKQSYRYAYTHPYHHSKMLDADVKYSTVTEEIYGYFKTNIVDYLGIDRTCFQLKVEKLIYTPESSGHENRFSRMSHIVPRDSRGENDPLKLEQRWGTGMWHTDVGCPLNNMILMIYLSDVEDDMGGLVMADPPQKVGFDDDLGLPKYLGAESPVYGDDIPSKEITGPAGTIVGFNSHTLHRANPPKKGYRKSLHMNIISDYPEHLAESYMPKDFLKKVVDLK